MQKQTSWGKFARWYDELLQSGDTYQAKVILPNLLRLMKIQKGETILDLACGQGFFAREFHKVGGRVTGIDVSKKLIALAVKQSPDEIRFLATSAHKLSFLKNSEISKIALVLALQNIEDVRATLEECARVLSPSGTMFIVLNHPAFRIPKDSGWQWDEVNRIQYRRIDAYLSERASKIQMHPGEAPAAVTVSFHRPLQFYFKLLKNTGFAITALEEWISHRVSQPGPRSAIEDKARQEFPLFLFLEARKIGKVFSNP